MEELKQTQSSTSYVNSLPDGLEQSLTVRRVKIDRSYVDYITPWINRDGRQGTRSGHYSRFDSIVGQA